MLCSSLLRLTARQPAVLQNVMVRTSARSIVYERGLFCISCPRFRLAADTSEKAYDHAPLREQPGLHNSSEHMPSPVNHMINWWLYLGGLGGKGIIWVPWMAFIFMWGVYCNTLYNHEYAYRINQKTGDPMVDYTPWEPFKTIRRTVGIDVLEPYRDTSTNFVNLADSRGHSHGDDHAHMEDVGHGHEYH